MRYMMLIYSEETESATPREMHQVSAAHRAIMDETARRGIFRAADPLQPTATSTTVRMQNGNVLLTDGPFAETKEQLAGYYILDCNDLDEALEWAARIHTACQDVAAVEVRPIREIQKPVRDSQAPHLREGQDG